MAPAGLLGLVPVDHLVYPSFSYLLFLEMDWWTFSFFLIWWRQSTHVLVFSWIPMLLIPMPYVDVAGLVWLLLPPDLLSSSWSCVASSPRCFFPIAARGANCSVFCSSLLKWSMDFCCSIFVRSFLYQATWLFFLLLGKYSILRAVDGDGDQIEFFVIHMTNTKLCLSWTSEALQWVFVS